MTAQRRWWGRAGALGVIAMVAACGNELGAADAGVPDPPASGELTGLPTGSAQWALLCAKGYRDPISLAFCAGSQPPALYSLIDLEDFLGFDLFSDSPAQVVMTSVSTGLGVRTVTPLNPRAIAITGADNAESDGVLQQFAALGFARGEPLVELVANDASYQTLRFFMVRFDLACESTTTGCNNADLLTPTIESGWTGYTLYDDQTIKNTPLDCLVCHQTSGPGSTTFLRMQELQPPWEHWLSDESGDNLIEFLTAHDTETYAGFPVSMSAIYDESPGALQTLLAEAGFASQPNAFDSDTIEGELTQGPTSPTWQGLYANAVAGRAIAPPYYAENQTDPTKLDPMLEAYVEVMEGKLARDLLPDIRDTLLDDALPDMSIRPAPGLDGGGILIHMCSMCHNSHLDQTQTRARFNVETLDTMSRTEKDIAIERLQRADSDLGKMPPPRFHTLSDAERDLAIAELSK